MNRKVTRMLFLLAAFALRASGAPGAERPKDVYFALSSGIRIHALETGPANGAPALVLIPGWLLTATVWNAQLEEFGKARRVLALDPRSQGESTMTPEGDTPEQRARDLHEVLAQSKLGPIVLVGWSQGVQDVASYLEQFGASGIKGIVLVDAVVSAGAAAIVAQPGPAAEELGLLAVYARSPRAYVEGMMHAIIQRPLSPAELDGLLSQALKTPTAIGQAEFVSDFYGVDRTGSLARFDRPTLLIASASSPELAAQKAMAKKLPGCRVEVVEQAGHAVFIDQPQRFNALLRAFLQQLG